MKLLYEKHTDINEASMPNNELTVKSQTVKVGDIIFVIPEISPESKLSYELPPKKDAIPKETFVLKLNFSFPEYLDETVSSNFTAAHRVSVEYRHMGRVAKPAEGLDAKKDQWQSITPQPELGLTEYRSKQLTGGWGSISFQPIDMSFATPVGDPLIFSCSGHPPPKIHSCKVDFQYANGIHVWMYIPYHIFPQWKQIYTYINEQSRSYMTE